MNQVLISKDQVLTHAAQLKQQSILTQTFSYVRRFVAKKGGRPETFEIPIGSGADFQGLGYNIEYAKASDDAEHLWVKFSQEVGNRKWSNDYEPLNSIATPGVRNQANPPSRYGYRVFPFFAKENDKIKIEAINNSADDDLEIVVTMIGVLLFK